MHKKHLSLSNREEKGKSSQTVTRKASIGHYYPVFLNLKGKNVFVIGGGRVAERKILPLLKTQSGITVISPHITRRLEREKQKGRIRHICREYRKGDLRNAFLAIAATDSPAINERVSRDAACLVNVVDTPHLCNFIVPSVAQRGPLMIAISTSGISPGLSRSIRKEIQKLYSPIFAQYLKYLKLIRAQAMKRIDDPIQRGECLKEIASEKMLEMLRQQGFRKTAQVARSFVRKKTQSHYGKL
jgi:precorrin-2 dehydrogenase/sirohydrochlorin ferrochelatase